MSYTVRLRDGTKETLDDQNAKSLMNALSSSKSPFMVEIAGSMLKSSEIVGIKKNPHMPASKAQQLPQGKRCHGTRSIQLEISKRIKADYGKEWPKPMKDKAFREVYRHEIHDEDNSKWCDFIAGTCVCHDAPDSGKATTWRDVFPGALETLKGEA